MLTPVVVGFFGFLRARGKEPSTPSKIAWGIIICGVSSLVMVAACLVDEHLSRQGLVGLDLHQLWRVHHQRAVLAPIGLSLVSKVAPKRITSLMMGGWFLTTSLGGKISGILAGFWDEFEASGSSSPSAPSPPSSPVSRSCR